MNIKSFILSIFFLSQAAAPLTAMTLNDLYIKLHTDVHTTKETLKTMELNNKFDTYEEKIQLLSCLDQAANQNIFPRIQAQAHTLKGLIYYRLYLKSTESEKAAPFINPLMNHYSHKINNNNRNTNIKAANEHFIAGLRILRKICTPNDDLARIENQCQRIAEIAAGLQDHSAGYWPSGSQVKI